MRDNEETKQATHARHEQLTKPTGSLGRLEELDTWISARQGECPPRDLDDCRVYVFAGDHGVTQGEVSAYPSEVLIQTFANVEAKGVGINAIADIAGATVVGVDISLGHDVEGPYRIRRSCGSIDRKDATSEEEADKVIRTGIVITDAAIDEGANPLIAGDLGIGSITPATALIGSMTNSKPVVVVGRGAGIDDEDWKLKVAAICDTMFRVRRLYNDPVEILRRISLPDMTVMAALLAQAAVRRTPVTLDRVVVTSAVLLANQLAPGACNWWVTGHKSAEPAHALALRYLDKEPLLEYGMHFGEGFGAVAILPLTKSDISVLRNMAVLAGAGVSTKD